MEEMHNKQNAIIRRREHGGGKERQDRLLRGSETKQTPE